MDKHTYLSRIIGESILTHKCFRVHLMVRITQFTYVSFVFIQRTKIVRHAVMSHKAPCFTRAFPLHLEALNHVTLKSVSFHRRVEFQNTASTCQQGKELSLVRVKCYVNAVSGILRSGLVCACVLHVRRFKESDTLTNQIFWEYEPDFT